MVCSPTRRGYQGAEFVHGEVDVIEPGIPIPQANKSHDGQIVTWRQMQVGDSIFFLHPGRATKCVTMLALEGRQGSIRTVSEIRNGVVCHGARVWRVR